MPRHPLPCLWLLSDARNDAALEQALARLPAGSGFVYRHYHLAGDRRRARFDTLHRIAAGHGHCTILAGDAETAVEWGADGIYGAPGVPGDSPGLLRLATAHDEGEIAQANAAKADAIFLSPVFPTRSHPGAQVLGMGRFHQLAALSDAPVIALGGMDRERAQQLGWPRWAAIDGLS